MSMEINIVDYTSAQLAALSVEQLEEVRVAQRKKNELEQNLQKQLAEEKKKLIDHGMHPSSVWECMSEDLTAACEAKIDIIRDALLFYLQYARLEEGATTVPSAPYNVDYSLNQYQRMLEVRAYYDATYSDPAVRAEAFYHDEFAKVYLGEVYAPLYHALLNSAT